MTKWLRENLLIVLAVILGPLFLAIFTWQEWEFFKDQAVAHHEDVPDFWSAAHMHDWLYNAFANFCSEVIFGLLIVTVALRIEGKRGKDKA